MTSVEDAEYTPSFANAMKEYVTTIGRHDLIEQINADTKKLKPKEKFS